MHWRHRKYRYILGIRKRKKEGIEIPLVNAGEYGNEISIEHYYKKADLTKEDANGRRLFLGSEFFASGFSRDGKLHTQYWLWTYLPKPTWLAASGLKNREILRKTEHST